MTTAPSRLPLAQWDLGSQYPIYTLYYKPRVTCAGGPLPCPKQGSGLDLWLSNTTAFASGYACAINVSPGNTAASYNCGGVVAQYVTVQRLGGGTGTSTWGGIAVEEMRPYTDCEALSEPCWDLAVPVGGRASSCYLNDVVVNGWDNVSVVILRCLGRMAVLPYLPVNL